MKKLIFISLLLMCGCITRPTVLTFKDTPTTKQKDTLPPNVSVYGIMLELPDSTLIDTIYR